MKNLSGKPHITYEPVAAKIGFKLAQWRCDGSGVTGWGSVPGLAYLDWFRAASGLKLNEHALPVWRIDLPEPPSPWARLANRFNWRKKS